MGFDINDLVGKSVETTVAIAGQEAKVWYDPNVITKARITAAEKGDEEFLDFFVDLVQDWEVTQGGVKVPITQEALEPLPVVALRAIFMHIVRESSSGEMGKVSSATSRRRVPQDRKARTSQRRSGTATSKSRATSG